MSFGHIRSKDFDGFSLNSSGVRQTKIVATLGPSSFGKIKQLIEAGVNVFRVNFSHAIHEKSVKIIQDIRTASEELGITVGILGDLCGPKVRCNGFDTPTCHIELVAKETVKLAYSESDGTDGLITTDRREVIQALEPGHRVLLADGSITLRVVARLSEDELECSVIIGGTLSRKKGINCPDVALNLSALTDKDKDDMLFMLKNPVDIVALSFVQRPQDILDLKIFIADNTGEGELSPLIIAKIEKPQALDCLQSIIDVSDGIMVARGDLGVEYSLARVPLAQKAIIEMCANAGKPVITATQMLMSMVTNPFPTRAEVSDVANAIFDGTDAVMTSDETATGEHPINVVQQMSEICQESERGNARIYRPCAPFDEMGVAFTAVNAAVRTNAKAILVATSSGTLARRISKYKPKPDQVIVAYSVDPVVCRQLMLSWGVAPVLLHGPFFGSDDIIVRMERALQSKGWASSDEIAIICAGQDMIAPGLENTIKIVKVGRAQKSNPIKSKWCLAVEGAMSQKHS